MISKKIKDNGLGNIAMNLDGSKLQVKSALWDHKELTKIIS